MNATDSVIGYMKHKNTIELGFMKYCYFKKIISYVLDYHNEYRIRKLFLIMCDKGHFIRRKMVHKASYKYKFIPNTKKKVKEDYEDKKKIDFIVSWD